MARIFSISFQFNDEAYATMVTVRTTPFYIEYTLNNLPFELIPFLPGSKIISLYPRQFFFPHVSPEHSVPLMNIIIEAVAQHLEVINS